MWRPMWRPMWRFPYGFLCQQLLQEDRRAAEAGKGTKKGGAKGTSFFGSSMGPTRDQGLNFFFVFLRIFWGIFRIFGQILWFLVPGRSESCRRLRDLQKSIVILSNGAVWTRNVTLLMKELPPQKLII